MLDWIIKFIIMPYLKMNKILNSWYCLQYIFQIYGSNRGRVEITVGNHRNSSFYLLFLVNSQRVTSRKQSYLGASGGLKIFQAKKGDFVISFLSLLMFLDLLSTFFKGEQNVAGASRHCYFFLFTCPVERYCGFSYCVCPSERCCECSGCGHVPF